MQSDSAFAHICTHMHNENEKYTNLIFEFGLRMRVCPQSSSPSRTSTISHTCLGQNRCVCVFVRVCAGVCVCVCVMCLSVYVCVWVCARKRVRAGQAPFHKRIWAKCSVCVGAGEGQVTCHKPFGFKAEAAWARRMDAIICSIYDMYA